MKAFVVAVNFLNGSQVMGFGELFVDGGGSIFIFKIGHGHLMIFLSGGIEFGLDVVEVGGIEGGVVVLGHHELLGGGG